MKNNIERELETLYASLKLGLGDKYGGLIFSTFYNYTFIKKKGVWF